MIEYDQVSGFPIFRPDGIELRRFMRDRASRVKIIQGPQGCLSGDTEFLTPTGWLPIAEYRSGMLVAEWGREGDLSFHIPIRFIDEPCEEMWKFHNKHSLSMVLSDEHRVPLYDREGKFVVRSAADVASAPGRYDIPINFVIADGGMDMSDAEIRLGVALNADGCWPKRGDQIIVCVRKERKKQRIRQLLAAAEIEWNEFQHSTRPTEVAFAFARGGRVKGFTERWWDANSRQFAIIIDECSHWDGLADSSEGVFYSKHERDADFIQFAAHGCGRRATISRRKDKRDPSWAEMFHVHFSAINSAKCAVGIRSDSISIDRVPAPGGRKYCFETQSGFFLARHNGRIFVTGNSGTSSACCMHLFQQALEQPPQRDGFQYFRAHILRETYSKLEETTIPTWKDWFRPGTKAGEFGIFYETRPYRHEVRVGRLKLDVTFMALEDIRDAKSFFMSLETSIIWFNEVQFAQYEVFSEAVGRVSPPRYPAVKDGGCAWGGLIADTNAPPADHWLPIMRGDVPPPDWMTEEKRDALKKPKNWGFYMQPPGLIEEFEEYVDGEGHVSRRLTGYRPNPEAENLKYLPKDFYVEKIAGKTKSWIDSNIMNRSSVVTDGKPVYPQFRREVNVAQKPLEIIPGIPVTVGLDFGRQPAAAIGQMLRNDWFIQREYIGRDMSAAEFAPLLKTYLSQQYPGFTFIFWGDPAGQHRGEATDKTPFLVFAENGMMVLPAPNPQNQRSIRHEAVNGVLMRRSQSGRPSSLLIDPGCVTLITGLAGGYFMRRLRVSGERYSEEPDKNQYSHVCEAFENALLGGGEGRQVTMGHQPGHGIKVMARRKTMRRIAG